MKTIYVQDISHFAAFDEDGKTLRREILSVLDADPTEKIELDFSGITMFSTMFFNASRLSGLKKRRRLHQGTYLL